MLSPFPVRASLALATFSILLSIYSFMSPLSFADGMGLDLPPDPSPSSNLSLRFVPLFGGRNLGIGLMIWILYLQNMPRAMGTVMLCCSVSAAVDCIVTWHWGGWSRAWSHVLGGLVFGWTGWKMLRREEKLLCASAS